MHLGFVGDLSLEPRRAHDHRSERVPQIVSEDADEHLVETERLRDLPALARQLEEHVRLALQDMRIDRLEQEVDGAGLIALEHALRITGPGSYEDDRHALGSLNPAHQLGELEAVHHGHLHVKQCQRHVVYE